MSPWCQPVGLAVVDAARPRPSPRRECHHRSLVPRRRAADDEGGRLQLRRGAAGDRDVPAEHGAGGGWRGADAHGVRKGGEAEAS